MALSFMNFLRGIFKTKLENGTVHHAIIQSLYDSFIMADEDLDLFRLELCLSTASGIWLDYWGEFFTVHRKLNESDDAYAKRIIDYVIKPKTTIPAIKNYIVDFLNEKYNTSYTTGDVKIKEPWEDIGKLSHKGKLSDSTRFFSGNYYSHSILDISIPEEITQDLVDLLMSVKAAGVKIVWSFLNSYDVIKGFETANTVFGQHARHIFTQTQRNIYGGLILSNTSNSPYLSGRREIWEELTTTYYWYAKMLDKDTDNSVVITNMDLARMLEYFNIDEVVTEIKDSGAKFSVDAKLSDKQAISGKETLTEVVEKSIKITQNMLDTIKFIDDWLTLSHKGQLSNDNGIMFKFEASHELYGNIMKYLEKFKKDNREYYDRLQPPLIASEHIAHWYVVKNNNWLFDTPTMSQEDFYELWGMSQSEGRTLQDVYDFEQISDKKYLTFGDLYQPPIVIAGSPWDWTPILDSPWLWSSAVLNNSELEEIYRRKFSGFPDMVEIQTKVTTHPENNFNLSDNGVLSPEKWVYEKSLKRSPELSLRLSGDGVLSEKISSGKEIETVITKLDNPEFNGYKYVSGDESIVTKYKIVTENVPTLGTLIDFEENQDVDNYNEKIEYSTREWFQAPVQLGEYAMWLVVPNIRQLWNTIAITNEEILGYWDSPDGTSEVKPDNFEENYLKDERIYQPPIVRTDSPFYWTTDHSEFDEEWLWSSATLNYEDLQEAYLTKFSDNLYMFPDIVTTRTLVHKTPSVEFRLSDNGYLPNNRVEVDTKIITHPEDNFVLSQNSIISNRSTEYRTNTEVVNHPENSFRLSDNGVISNTEYLIKTKTVSHSEDNFVLDEGLLDSRYKVSGGKIEDVQEFIKNPRFSTFHKLSGDAPEVIKTVEEITYDELPLKYLSGRKSDIEVTETFIPDKNGVHYLSGTKSTYYEETTVEEHPVTLGGIIELEEKQKNFPYSSRYVLQSHIMLGEQVMWLVMEEYSQLWNTIAITNEEIWEFCEDISRENLEEVITADTVKYQLPIMTSDTPFYWITPKLSDGQLWNTIAITNEEIMGYWNSQDGDTPLSNVPKNFAAMIFLDEKRYQLPIMRTDEPFYWITPRLSDRQLWNTIAITNEEIMGYWDSPEGKANIETLPNDFEENYLKDERIYQPPIVRTDSPFYWVNDHDEFDTGEWLWDAGTLTIEEIETVFHTKFVKNPSAFPNSTTIEIKQVKNKATQLTLSGNGKLSGVDYEKSKKITTNPENSFRLSDNGVISNRGVEYRTHIETIYHSENSFRLSDSNSRISPSPYILQISLESYPENSLKLSDLKGELSTTQYTSGRKSEIVETRKENPEFKGYTLISGSIPEVKKTVEEIVYPELKLTYMSGDKSDITEETKIKHVYGYEQRLSGDLTVNEEVVIVLENTPTLGRLIELEENQQYKYYTKDRLQSPVQVNQEHIANWKIKADYPQLWNSQAISNSELLEFSDENSIGALREILLSDLIRYQPPIDYMSDPIFWSVIKVKDNKLWNNRILSNKEIVKYWEGEKKITPAEYELYYLENDTYHTPPIDTQSVYEKVIVAKDYDWLWDSRVLVNSELEGVYERKLNTDDFILKDIINYEENNGDKKYSIRENSQSPIQITEF